MGPGLVWSGEDQLEFEADIESTKAILQDALEEFEIIAPAHGEHDLGAQGHENRGPELFLSHSAVDAELAEYLETTVGNSVPGLEVFRTTRVGEVRAGEEWFNEITNHLKSADRFLVLLTQSSMNRPWVCFEMGAAWLSEKVLVPVLAPGLSPNEVPEPLRLLQLLSLDDPDEAAEVFSLLGGRLADPEAFVLLARELGRQGQSLALAEQFDGIPFEKLFYAHDGPLENLAEADAVPITEHVTIAFKKAGYDTAFAVPRRPEKALAAGFQKVWQIDTSKRKRPLLSNGLRQLYVKRQAT